MANYKSKNKVFNVNACHLLCLLPIVLFSYYKNGYLVYKANYMSFFSTLEYLIIPIIIVVISYLFEIYYYVGIKKERNFNNVVNSFSPFANLLCYLVCGPNDALYIIIPLIFLVDILMKLIDKKVTINRVALFKIILFIVLAIFGLYNNANTLERIKNIRIFTNAESFLGLSIGEIGVVSNLFVILSFMVLLFNKYYKKDIALSALITYFLFGIFFVIVGTLSMSEFLNHTFSSGVLFAIVYVLTLSDSSPILGGGRKIYGILFGILVSIFINVFQIYISIYFIILVLSLISPLINRLKISIYK